MYSNVSLEKGHRKVARVGESGGCTTVQFHTEESVPELACLHKVQQEGGVEGGGECSPLSVSTLLHFSKVPAERAFYSGPLKSTQVRVDSVYRKNTH